jgi:hypothetical protein
MALPRYNFAYLNQTADKAGCNHAAESDTAETEIDELQGTGILVLPLGMNKNGFTAARTVTSSETVLPSSPIDDFEGVDGILMVPLGQSKKVSPPARTVEGSSKNEKSSSLGCEYGLASMHPSQS